MSSEENEQSRVDIVSFPEEKIIYSVGLYEGEGALDVFCIRDPRRDKESGPHANETVSTFVKLVLAGEIDIDDGQINRYYHYDENLGHVMLYWWPGHPSFSDKKSEYYLARAGERHGDENFDTMQVVMCSQNKDVYFSMTSVWDDKGSYEFGFFPAMNYKAKEFSEHFSKACTNYGCRSPGKLFCSSCKIFRFCSKKCFSYVWKLHKSQCKTDIFSKAIFYSAHNLVHIPSLMNDLEKMPGFDYSKIASLSEELYTNIDSFVIKKRYMGSDWFITLFSGYNFTTKSNTTMLSEVEMELFLSYAVTVKENHQLNKNRPSFFSIKDPEKPKAPVKRFLIVPLDLQKFFKTDELLELFFFNFFMNLTIPTEEALLFQILPLGSDTLDNIPPWHPENKHSDPYKDLHPCAHDELIAQLSKNCHRPFCANTTFSDEFKHPCLDCDLLVYCSKKCRNGDRNRHRYLCKQDKMKKLFDMVDENFTNIYEMD